MSQEPKKLLKGNFYVWEFSRTIDDILDFAEDRQLPVGEFGRFGDLSPTGFPFDSVDDAIKVGFYSSNFPEEFFKVIDHEQNVVFDSADEKNQDRIFKVAVKHNCLYVHFSSEASLLETIRYGHIYSTLEEALADIINAEGKKVKVFNGDLEVFFEGEIKNQKVVKKQ